MTIYSNVVIEDAFNSILNTKLDMNQFLTVDTSLEENAGNIKNIVTYTPSGSVDDVARTEGNSNTVDIAQVTVPYTVGYSQAKAIYYDEDFNQDPNGIEYLLKGEAEKMVNHWNNKLIGEYEKATVAQSYSGSIGFDTFVDALGKLNTEEEEKYFALINPHELAAFRKALKDNLSYSEAFVRTGYIGSVCGVPVYVSKSVPVGVAYIAAKEAVRLFVKKNTETELERDGEHRKNTVYLRKCAVCALVDATKLCRIAPAAVTTATLTTYTKNAKTIAGAATTGATVTAYVNGVKAADAVTASNNAYTITASANLAAGDIVKVCVYKADEVYQEVSATVAS